MCLIVKMRVFVNIKFHRRCFNKCRKEGISNVLKQALRDHKWDKVVSLWRPKKKFNSVPKDVPKGHLAVYVGGEGKRYVINIAFLKHPLFQALLSHVEEVFQFANGSRLCIPCDEYVFLSVLQCFRAERDRRFPFCL